ncbi:AraC family transcriptional regulator [Noviherbaspirillum sp.]|uniref:AraC family transcriptional regulator n=1 Tax=Noviherbaspirillum sp. TaxID=1926288 RepID=UPI002FE331B8
MTVTHNTIAILQVEQILQGVREQGRDVSAILLRSGISPALLESPLSRVSQAQYTALIRTLTRITRDELWGLCSRPVKIGTFARNCRALVHCRSLREALTEGFRYYHLALEDMAPRLRIEGEIAHVVLQSRAERNARLRFVERTFMFFTFGLACWLVARRIPLIDVDYSNADRKLSSDAFRVFQATVHYQDGPVGFRFEKRWLDLPVVQNVQSVEEFLHQAPASLLVKYRDHANVTERIRRILRRHLDGEMPSLEEVSKSLAVTPQTLRRRLQDEGQGYQTIKDDLRRDVAIEYLARADLTLIEIANLVGFSEPSTFHRAFKKWTGVAPGEYRNTRLHAADARADVRAGTSSMHA